MSRLDEAKRILMELHDRVADINDVAIARTNGLVILSLRKSASSDEKSERLLGGMASALFSISKRAADQLLKGNFQSLLVQIDTGSIFVIFTGSVVLIALTKPEPNLGLLSLEMEDAAAKLNKIFS
ncbi:MAG: hypothetical protein Kow0069_25560 [Promethearchaeota archaeon]